MNDYADLLSLGKFHTILADPPWKFQNSTGKMAPEHKRLYRYHTMTNEEIISMPVREISYSKSHLYLWIPNALIDLGLQVMKSWGFEYKTMIVWYKIRKDGGPDRRGVGFYFRNVTEVVLFGTRGQLRTLQPARTQENIILSQKRGHSIKPDELYSIIEACSEAPFIELFARRKRQNWASWGDEVEGPIKNIESYNNEYFFQQRILDNPSEVYPVENK